MDDTRERPSVLGFTLHASPIVIVGGVAGFAVVALLASHGVPSLAELANQLKGAVAAVSMI